MKAERLPHGLLHTVSCSQCGKFIVKGQEAFWTHADSAYDPHQDKAGAYHVECFAEIKDDCPWEPTDWRVFLLGEIKEAFRLSESYKQGHRPHQIGSLRHQSSPSLGTPEKDVRLKEPHHENSRFD